MDVFRLRETVIHEYADYVRSFVQLREPGLREYVEKSLTDEALWPQPLIQMNPTFEFGGELDALVKQGKLKAECQKIFRIKTTSDPIGLPMRLHRHQIDAIRAAKSGLNYVLTTGTGSGKSLAYLVPIVDHVLSVGKGNGIKAIVVYPMNALCNSQYGELEKFLRLGYGVGNEPVRFDRYTGQEDQQRRDEIAANPPDILLTNYVMLELLLTRPFERKIINAARDLRFLVLDELHTYRGRQGADVALLTRRVREACQAKELLCVGTSATMASGGSFANQSKQIAEVASRLFGAKVEPEAVIGETLTRATGEHDLSTPSNIAHLRDDIEGPSIPTEYPGFVATMMASWLEGTFGLRRDPEDNRLVRAKPLSISGESGAARKLSQLTSLDESKCANAIRSWLLAGHTCQANPETSAKPFAFRLQQFISRGDAVFASLEDVGQRYFSLSGQQFVPGDRNRHLYPLAFCRECGADYYTVWKVTDRETKSVVFKPRKLSDRGLDDEEGEAGFLYRDPERPWPEDPEEIVQRVPEEWIEESGGKPRVRSTLRNDVPTTVRIAPNGEVSPDGQAFAFLTLPFRFCLCCEVSYRARRGESDFGRLATLATGGRSTATTILSLYAVRFLRSEASLQEHARKLLSFTDNRQDASLQAGHFNDFVEVSLLRAALYKAVAAAGTEGISHDELAQKVFKALTLPLDLYAREPGVQFAQRAETDKAFRNVLGYRLYRDLKRGWRVTSPNLEQCGLLKIDYPSLDELCQAEDRWQGCHAALVMAAPKTRERIARVLLDYLRRELAIDVDYLKGDFFERLQMQSSQRLRAPWAIDEQEKPELASAVFPRARNPHDRMYFSYLSGRSGFGIFLGRRGTFPEFERSGTKLRLADKDAILRDLFRVLKTAQYLVETAEPTGDSPIPGYQLSAAAMCWHAADGTVAFHDPIRVPNPPEKGGRTNPFFVRFYQHVAGSCRGLEAREHTAQVPYDERERREKDFGDGKLPVLYCSPTMELGVDIRQLNVVNMRNVPPTPANYAQRSGRAGRSGQPAFVLTYCATGNSHDQYFFRLPERMVSGAVSPPRLDLANEDLIKAHAHAVWLAETETFLGNSLTEILDVHGVKPSLALLPSIRTSLTRPGVLEAAYRKSTSILKTIEEDLREAPWYTSEWLKLVLDHTMQEFEAACNRWRSLFLSAKAQFEYQNSIISDVARRPMWEEAKRLRREAEAQIELLTDAKNVIQSDFYSYRYFASEGFLPGYNFPRLPLSAYIPARRRVQGKDEFLSRPRFLAISEFGPRSIIYHEGSRYIVNKVILPVGLRKEPNDEGEAITVSVKQCGGCGYIHELGSAEAGPNCCENCGSANLERMDRLLRLQNVSTKRRDRITSDEEERTRMGYEIRTGLRFKEVGGVALFQVAEVTGANGALLKLTYGDATDIWRVNLGWRRRAEKNRLGFVLDMEKGYWQRSDQLPDEEDPADPLGAKTERVVPFVEDRRNCLIIEPMTQLDPKTMTSLQAAVKKAIQALYQLEDNELAAETLPSSSDRRRILLYESAEGGAGVLRRLLDDADSFAEIAIEALRICHFDPVTGDDKHRADGASEDCEAACYDCLMSYANQRDHELLDRKMLLTFLQELRSSRVKASPSPKPFADHLETLKAGCDSNLEKQWLDYLALRGHRLPSVGQKHYAQCSTRPDFVYEREHTAIYVDGPPHDFPERQQRDADASARMEDLGITVLRFHHQDNWAEIIARYPNVFGIAQITTTAPAANQ